MLFKWIIEVFVSSKRDGHHLHPRRLLEPHQLDLESGKLRLGPSQVSASNISAVFNGYQILLDGDVQFSPKTDLAIELSIQNIDLREFKSWQLPDIFDAQNADLHIEIKSDLTQSYVEVRLDESATSTLIAHFETLKRR